MVRWLTWTKFRTSPRKMRGKFRTKLKYGIFPAEKSPRGISPPPLYVPHTCPRPKGHSVCARTEDALALWSLLQPHASNKSAHKTGANRGNRRGFWGTRGCNVLSLAVYVPTKKGKRLVWMARGRVSKPATLAGLKDWAAKGLRVRRSGSPDAGGVGGLACAAAGGGGRQGSIRMAVHHRRRWG